MTKWKGINEICKKYDVSYSRINQWRYRGEITISTLGGYPMVDEDSLLERLEMNKKEAISTANLKIKKDKFIRENNEHFFLLQSMETLTPIMHSLIIELAGVILNGKRRELFLHLALHGDINDYAEKCDTDTETIKATFKSIIKEIMHNSNFLLKLRNEDIAQRVTIATQRLINRDNLNTRITIPNKEVKKEIPEQVVKLLVTHISEMGFDARSQHTLIQNKISTLSELLLYTKQDGFSKLLRLNKYGIGSLNKLMQRLRDIGILNDKNECELYEYL